MGLPGWRWIIGLAALTGASEVSAQSVTLEPSREERPAPEPAAAEPATRPTQAREEPSLPRAIAADVSYPDGASGDHEVVLEILVKEDGSVLRARALSGELPFSAAAERAALSWRFEPARRAGKPVRAKIHFLVSFVEPELVEPRGQDEANELLPGAAEPRSGAGDPPLAEAQAGIEVLVEGERAGMRRRLTQAEVRELPGAFGDAFRAIEVLPGVTPIVSGVPYFYVRGAPPGNVGYLFDGIVVPVLYHFAGGPGVLHPAFVERVDLYAGAYPARHGRYVGGLVVGEMAPPSGRLRGEASVRLIDSGGMVEAPFAEGRGNVMLGGRYSYTALVLSLIVPDLTVQYWDYQARVRYAVDDDDSVEALGFGSTDFIQETQEDSGSAQTLVNLGFHRLDLRWERELEDGKFRQALMTGIDRTIFDEEDVRFTNTLLGTRSDLVRRLDSGLLLRLGADVLYERLAQDLEDGLLAPDPEPPTGSGVEQPNQTDTSDDELGLGFDAQRSDLSLGLHADLVIDASTWLEIVPGLRGDLFVSGDAYAIGLDPRISARFRINPGVSLVHGLGVTHQTPSFVVPVPGVKPNLEGGLQRALQHSSGVEVELGAGMNSSVVFFQNLFFDMTDLIGLAQLNQTGEDVDQVEEDDIFRMDGRGVGLELMVQRSLSHRLGGFFSYTLARSERFAGRLEGPATTDRTHVLNLALSYDLGRNWRFGGRGLFYTGIPASVAYLEAAKTPPRTPPFWRLDWRLQKRWPNPDGRRYWGLVVEVLNTTLNQEVLEKSCNAFACTEQAIGPVTIPSIGVEAAF